MKQTFTREEILQAICELESKVGIESHSTVLDWKESLGFERYEEYDDERMSEWDRYKIWGA
jgi:hypothetical protein